MDEIFIKATDLEARDFKYIQEYFNNKDFICLLDILDAFEYELEKLRLKEVIWDELDNQFAESERKREEHEIDEHYS